MMKTRRVLALAVGLTLVGAPGFADPGYRIQPILKVGDRVGDLRIAKPDFGPFDIGGLNDRGQIFIGTGSAAGGELLLQYGDDKLTPIVVARQPSPTGTWPGTVVLIFSAQSMNQHGNMVFGTGFFAGSADFPTLDAVYRWDFKAQKVSLVARDGIPVTPSLTLGGGGDQSAINNRNEIALVFGAKTDTGLTGLGLFFVGSDDKLVPVAVPGQTLPGGATIAQASFPSINDAGKIAFVASPRGEENTPSGYVWEAGTITPVALAGAEIQGVGTIRSIRGVRVSKDGSVLVAVRVLVNNASRVGLFRFAEGKLTPVALPGQEMHGGGKLRTLPEPQLPITYAGAPAMSAASEAGEYAFLATLEDNSTAAYRLKPNGEISLILKSGTTTDLGRVTRVGTPAYPSIGLNSLGQVALSLRIEGRPDTLVLLTPSAP
jgi:hypothetical protein